MQVEQTKKLLAKIMAGDDNNEQDILDQHVSRVWSDTTPRRSPGNLSPCAQFQRRRPQHEMMIAGGSMSPDRDGSSIKICKFLLLLQAHNHRCVHQNRCPTQTCASSASGAASTPTVASVSSRPTRWLWTTGTRQVFRVAAAYRGCSEHKWGHRQLLHRQLTAKWRSSFTMIEGVLNINFNKSIRLNFIVHLANRNATSSNLRCLRRTSYHRLCQPKTSCYHLQWFHQPQQLLNMQQPLYAISPTKMCHILLRFRVDIRQRWDSLKIICRRREIFGEFLLEPSHENTFSSRFSTDFSSKLSLMTWKPESSTRNSPTTPMCCHCTREKWRHTWSW